LPYEVNVNDIWGYSTPYGDEYAIVGLQNGTSIVKVSDDEIFEVGFIHGETSTWRDIKTWDKFIYVGTENGSGGIQVISMEDPNNPQLVNVWTGIGSSHNIMIDNGYLYITGSPEIDLIILSLENPETPELVGTWDGDYFHDVCIKDDLLFGCGISSDNMYVLDISNKDNPISISYWTGVPSAHACWVDPNRDLLLTASETSGGHIMNWDISDINNVQLLSEWAPDSSETKSAHNVFIKDNFAYISYYVFGLQIIDLTDPVNPTLAGFYDTFPGMVGLFNGAWGTYPFQSSCNIYISDRQTGLYVIEFDGCSGADPDDPIPPQNLLVYSDYLTPNSISLNWENPNLLYNGELLNDFNILLYRNDELLIELSQSTESFTDINLLDGNEYFYSLKIKSNINDSLSIGSNGKAWSGGHYQSNPPTIINSNSIELTIAQFDIQIPNTQIDGTPLDDVDQLIVIRNGSIIDSIFVLPNEIIQYQNIPIPGYFYNYQFYVIDNEFPINESSKTDNIEIYIGEEPAILGIHLCENTIDDGELFIQDLNFMGINSYLLNENNILINGISTNIETLFLFAGIFPNNCQISNSMTELLLEFIQTGGNIYLEGGDIWMNLNQSELINYFGVKFNDDGEDDLYSIFGLEGTILDSFSINYNGENNWIDQIHAISPAYPTIQNQSSEFITTVFNPAQEINTIASSFQISGIESDIERRYLISKYLLFLELGHEPEWIKGDYNRDEFVNIIDILMVVDVIIEYSNPNEIQYWISDLNHDDLINIQDISLIVNTILFN
jgi:choice-of-anchor B domain-containing protein